MSKEEDKQEIPDIIYDSITKTSYKKGRFFGKVRIHFLCLSWCLVQKENIFYDTR